MTPWSVLRTRNKSYYRDRKMDRANEKSLASRATSLGRSANADAFDELATLTVSNSALVRRLAASALGKLAGIVPPEPAISTLRPLLGDKHPQVRQYASKALGAFGVHARAALSDLRDLYRNPTEKDYVKRSVRTAGKIIQEAIRIAAKQARHHCRRCGARVDTDEYARSQRAFQRVFCDKCFDEIYLERRNFDTRVELNKTIRTRNGSFVQSDGERRIAEYLGRHGVAYAMTSACGSSKGTRSGRIFIFPSSTFILSTGEWIRSTTGSG